MYIVTHYERYGAGLNGALNGLLAGIFMGCIFFAIGIALSFLVFPLCFCLAAPFAPFLGMYIGYRGVGKMTCPVCGKEKLFSDWYPRCSCWGCRRRYVIYRDQMRLVSYDPDGRHGSARWRMPAP